MVFSNLGKFSKKLDQIRQSLVVSTISEREWRKLVGISSTLEDFELETYVKYDRVKLSIESGIPDSLRPEIWSIFCRAD